MSHLLGAEQNRGDAQAPSQGHSQVLIPPQMDTEGCETAAMETGLGHWPDRLQCGDLAHGTALWHQDWK